jgi:predicted RNase H-like HicB family nuclease
MRTFVITATWDDEAQVWVADSLDVPGLATEAPTQEELIAKLKVMIPELLEANEPLQRPMPEYVMHWHRETRLRMLA